MTDNYFLMLQGSESIELCAERVLRDKACEFRATLMRSLRNIEIRIRETGEEGIKAQRRSSVRKSKNFTNGL